jgi:hypothetical protein
MRTKKFLVLGITASLIFISANLIFSQESVEPDTQWVWGEVNTLDTQNKTILVKYLDYETDQEKEATINVDDKTTYENIKSIDEIKPKDVLSIDYIVSSDGKNIAKNISVEKPENTQGVQEENISEEKKVSPAGVGEASKTIPSTQ